MCFPSMPSILYINFNRSDALPDFSVMITQYGNEWRYCRIEPDASPAQCCILFFTEFSCSVLCDEGFPEDLTVAVQYKLVYNPETGQFFADYCTSICLGDFGPGTCDGEDQIVPDNAPDEPYCVPYGIGCISSEILVDCECDPFVGVVDWPAAFPGWTINITESPTFPVV